MKFKVNGLTWNIQSVQRDSEKLKVNNIACLGVTCCHDLQIFLEKISSKCAAIKSQTDSSVFSLAIR